MKKTFALFLALFILFRPVHAPAGPLATAAADNGPVEITAEKSLVWNRKAKTYTAYQNVIATQGQKKITGDTLTAAYPDDKAAGDISTLTAEGHVTLAAPPYQGHGDRMVYDVKTGRATLTGSNMKIFTDPPAPGAPGQSLTARDKIEFFTNENKLVATGNATAVKGADTLTADQLTAYFVKDAQGQTSMKQVVAEGSAVVKTDKETLYGDHGTYDIPTQQAVLTGNVKILQDKNWLQGTRATIDMNTGISQLFAGDVAAGQRVKGVFYPTPKPGAAASPAPSSITPGAPGTSTGDTPAPTPDAAHSAPPVMPPWPSGPTVTIPAAP